MLALQFHGVTVGCVSYLVFVDFGGPFSNPNSGLMPSRFDILLFLYSKLPKMEVLICEHEWISSAQSMVKK